MYFVVTAMIPHGRGLLAYNADQFVTRFNRLILNLRSHQSQFKYLPMMPHLRATPGDSTTELSPPISNAVGAVETKYSLWSR